MKNFTIKGIKAENFKGFEKIDVEFGDGHTRIVGVNGSGKSSLVDVLHACLKTISQNGSKGELIGNRFSYIGPHGVNSNVCTFLRDEKEDLNVTITNKISKAGNEIKIEASDGRTLDRKWLNDFFNVAFLSAKNFTSLDPTKQALSLGVDTSKFDEEIKGLKAEFTVTNRTVKAFGEIENLPPVDKVDVRALYEKRDRIKEHNDKQDALAEKTYRYERAIEDQQSRIQSINDSLERENKELARLKTVRDKELPQPEDKVLTLEINEQIDNAAETNRMAEAYERNEARRADKGNWIEDLASNKCNQESVAHSRTQYIAAFDFGFEGLSVCDKGGLLLNNRRLGEFSTAEQVIIVNKLNAARNPDLKTVFIDGFESLDPVNQGKIVDELIESGIQVITLEVGNAKKDKSTILLKGCKVVDDYKEKPVETKPSLLGGE